MRVYELARALGRPSSDVIAQLRANGEWVDSHLSTVPRPVVGRYLPELPPSDQTNQSISTREHYPRPRLPLVDLGALFKGRPGPRPFTMRDLARDEYDDTIELLRYAREITTRDVADLLGVKQATVRRWVCRGYLRPVGKLGPSNLFNTREVLAAHDDIVARRKATAQLRRVDRFHVELRPIHRIRPKHYDADVGVGEAARLLEVSVATIRSWIHRGHLTPLPSSRPRAIRLRLGDVITAARSRQLPGR
jgi:DNA-binding transcriptional MerR regulator